MGVYLDFPAKDDGQPRRLEDIYRAADVPLWRDVTTGKGSPRNKDGEHVVPDRHRDNQGHLGVGDAGDDVR